MATVEAGRIPDKQVPLDTIPLHSPGGEDRASDKDFDSATGESGEVTVFHNNEEFNVVHPLQHEWSLWFTKPPSGKVRKAAR